MNWGHFDLQSNALPLSYTPVISYSIYLITIKHICWYLLGNQPEPVFEDNCVITALLIGIFLRIRLRFKQIIVDVRVVMVEFMRAGALNTCGKETQIRMLRWQ